MKKYFIFAVLYTLIFSFLSTVNAAEKVVKPSWGENTDVFSKGFENQEPISDSKFKKTIEKIKERSLTKKQMKIRKEVHPLLPMSDDEHLKTITESFAEDDDLNQTHTVMIPVNAYNENGQLIYPGYYKLSCRKTSDNNYVLELAQGTKTILTVKAKQTNQDLEQDSISFCDAKIIDNERIRLMYGTIDLNLVGYLYFK